MPLASDAVELVIAALILTALLTVTVLGALTLRWWERRPRSGSPDEIVDPRRLGATAESLGETATLLQFSADAGERCPSVHRTLAAIALSSDDVVHLDVDLTDRPDIARHFQVVQTPTTFVLDSRGVIRTRFGGAPSRDVVQLEILRLRTEPTPV